MFVDFVGHPYSWIYIPRTCHMNKYINWYEIWNESKLTTNKIMSPWTSNILFMNTDPKELKWFHGNRLKKNKNQIYDHNQLPVTGQNSIKEVQYNWNKLIEYVEQFRFQNVQRLNYQACDLHCTFILSSLVGIFMWFLSMSNGAFSTASVKSANVNKLTLICMYMEISDLVLQLWAHLSLKTSDAFLIHV